MGNLSSKNKSFKCPQCSQTINAKPQKSPVVCLRCNLDLTQYKKNGDNKLRMISLAIINNGETLPPDFSEESLLKSVRSHLLATPQKLYKRNDLLEIIKIYLKVTALTPPFGQITHKTQILIESKNSIPVLLGGEVVCDVILRPTKATLSSRRLNACNVKRAMLRNTKNLHLNKDDTIVAKGVEFVVTKIYPNDGGYFREESLVELGNPVWDVKRAHLLPFYETLPRCDRGDEEGGPINEEEIVKKYFRRHFLGRKRFIKENEFITIGTVNFMVVACDPPQGVVTCETDFYANGNFLSLNNVRRLFNIIMLIIHHFYTLRYTEERNFNSNIDFGIFFNERKLVNSDIKRVKKEAETCRICLEEYEIGDTVMTLTCFHFYHKDCINTWLNGDRHCPVCKYRVY